MKARADVLAARSWHLSNTILELSRQLDQYPAVVGSVIAKSRLDAVEQYLNKIEKLGMTFKQALIDIRARERAVAELEED
jgi:hypothetical protein